MPNLLVTTPEYVLRYDVDARETFIIEAGSPEYYGVSWFPYRNEICLSHSGLDNAALEDVSDYIESEIGWLSRGSEKSGPFISQPHQILCLNNGTIAITNTGRNCLTIVNPDWFMRHHRFDDTRWDRLAANDRRGSHLNSLMQHDKFLYLLAHNFERCSFTLKLELPTFRLLETIQHQASGLHNLWLRDDGLTISCDTMRGGLISLRDDRTLWRSHDPNGLTRGLAATADRIYVGASTNRTRAERRAGETGIWIVDAGDFRTMDYHAIGHFGGVHEVRLLDEKDLCHPQGTLELSPYLVGTKPNLFLSRRKFAAVAARTIIDEQWDLVSGVPAFETGALGFQNAGFGLALLRNSWATDFRISGLLDVSDQGATHCGLIGRYRGPGDTNMIAAILMRDPSTASATISLWNENGAGWMCVGARPAPRSTVNVQLLANDNRVTVYCEGAEVLTADGLSMSLGGAVGVRGIGGIVRGVLCEILQSAEGC